MVVLDTTPLNYLVLIEHAHILPLLFTDVAIPPAVYHEMHHERTPKAVRDWIAQSPSWLTVIAPATPIGNDLADLGEGERQAITLAGLSVENILIVDDRLAREVAKRRGINVRGTLRTLTDASKRNLIPDLADAFARLRKTTFRAHARLFHSLLEENRQFHHSSTPAADPFQQ